MKRNYLLILPLVMILLFVPMAIRISNPSPEAFGGAIFLIRFFPVAFCIMIAAILTITIFFDGGKILWIATMIAYGISIFLFLPLSLYMSLPFGVLLFLSIKSNKHEKSELSIAKFLKSGNEHCAETHPEQNERYLHQVHAKKVL